MAAVFPDPAVDPGRDRPWGRPAWGLDYRAPPPFGVLLINAEDGPEDTLKPRFLAAEGDLDRCDRLIGLIGQNGSRLFFSLADVAYEAFDEVHWVSDREGFAATRALHHRHALYMGPTSGAAWMVAQWKARLEPDARVVVLLPDEGHRYQNTVYDDAWLRRHGLRLRRLPSRPVEVDDPGDGTPEWSWLRWNRRPLTEVVARGAAA